MALFAAAAGAGEPKPQDKPPAKLQPLIAVLHFNDKLRDKAVDVFYIDDVVRTETKRVLPDLRVMTRENQVSMLKDNNRDPEKCEGTCEVDTGHLLGADYTIAGDVLKFGSSFKVTLKLFESVGGQLLGGSEATGATIDDLGKGLREAVRELLAPLIAERAAVVRASEERAAAEKAAAAAEKAASEKAALAERAAADKAALEAQASARRIAADQTATERAAAEQKAADAKAAAAKALEAEAYAEAHRPLERRSLWRTEPGGRAASRPRIERGAVPLGTATREDEGMRRGSADWRRELKWSPL